MKKLKEALAKVSEALEPNRRLLARAQRRYKANRKRAYVAHNQQVRAQQKADRIRKTSPARARQIDADALRHGHVAYRNHQRAQFWLGRIKVLTQRLHGIESDHIALEAELRKLNHVTIAGNKATGGTRDERLRAVMLASAKACAAGHRPNFYSQIGSWDVDHCITGEHYGERSDCSSWATSVYRSAGLPDPNGERYSGGYTGTLGAHGKPTDNPKPGDLVLYGPFPHHHVEVVLDPEKQTTIGHGSAPVDQGVFDLFGDHDYVIRTYR